MKNQISPRDFETLSLYLDSQLSPAEGQRLEARLKTEPELQEALAGLQRTRLVLRSLPRVRPPRSFRLTPAMVGQRPARPVYPFFQFASAIATILFVFVLLGDFLKLPAAQTAQAPAAAPMIMAASTGAAAVQPPGLDDNGTPATRQALAQNSAEATPTLEDTYAPNQPPAAPTPGLAMKAPVTTTLGVETITGTGILTDHYALTTTEQVLSQAASPEAGDRAGGRALPPGSSPASLPFVRLVEISLAAVALLFGLAALILRRKL